MIVINVNTELKAITGKVLSSATMKDGSKMKDNWWYPYSPVDTRKPYDKTCPECKELSIGFHSSGANMLYCNKCGHGNQFILINSREYKIKTKSKDKIKLNWD